MCQRGWCAGGCKEMWAAVCHTGFMKKSAVHHALGMLKWATVLPSGCSQQQLWNPAVAACRRRGLP